MVSLRLSDEYEKKLEIISKTEKKSKSEIIKLALQQYFMAYEKEKSAYELGEEFFGKYGSGKSNLSSDYKKIFRNSFSQQE